MPRKSKAEQTMSASLYFTKLRGWQGLLDCLRADPPSEWRDSRIANALDEIRTYELFVRPVPRNGMTLEEERREEEAIARRVEAMRPNQGSSQPWNGFALYEGEERVC